MEQDKKKRGANYSFSERKNLLKICNKWKHVIESKRTDAVTWRGKEDAWRKIETEFNSTTTGIPRNAKQLKTKYEGIKKEMKKKYSSHKAYLRGTGGGEHVEVPKPETEEEKELFETIAISVCGLQSTFDSDAETGIGGIPLEKIVVENENIREDAVIEYYDVDWSGPSAGLLQTPVNPILKTTVNRRVTQDQSLTTRIEENEATNSSSNEQINYVPAQAPQEFNNNNINNTDSSKRS